MLCDKRKLLFLLALILGILAGSISVIAGYLIFEKEIQMPNVTFIFSASIFGALFFVYIVVNFLYDINTDKSFIQNRNYHQERIWAIVRLFWLCFVLVIILTSGIITEENPVKTADVIKRYAITLGLGFFFNPLIFLGYFMKSKRFNKKSMSWVKDILIYGVFFYGIFVPAFIFLFVKYILQIEIGATFILSKELILFGICFGSIIFAIDFFTFKKSGDKNHD